MQFDPTACQGEKGGLEVVAKLHPLDCFGERSLLHNHPRVATVRAGPGCKLYTLFIKRDE